MEHKFNHALASPRVVSEHTNGIWKGRFPWLRSIRMKITDDPKSVVKILRMIEATVVLHNMLIDFGIGDKDDELIIDDDITALDDPNRAPDDYALLDPLPSHASKDARR